VGRLKVVSSRQPHREPEVVRHAAPPDDVEFMNDARHGFREKARPFISTIVAHDVGPENGIYGLSSDRVVKANYSSDCREVDNPTLSTTGARNVGLEEDGQVQHRVATPFFSTTAALNVGPEVRINSRKDPALDSRTGANPSISTERMEIVDCNVTVNALFLSATCFLVHLFLFLYCLTNSLGCARYSCDYTTDSN